MKTSIAKKRMTNAGVAVMVTHRISANNYTRHRTLLWFPTEADQQAFLLFTSSSGNNRDEDLDQFASSVSLQKLVSRILQRPLSGVSSNEELPLGKGLLALKLFPQRTIPQFARGTWFVTRKTGTSSSCLTYKFTRDQNGFRQNFNPRYGYSF